MKEYLENIDYQNIISDVFNHLNITCWEVKTEKILPKQIEYNGEEYFIGIERNWDKKVGIIYHDVKLDIKSILHELLHIKYPQWINQDYNEYEKWIVWKTDKEFINMNKPVKKIKRNSDYVCLDCGEKHYIPRTNTKTTWHQNYCGLCNMFNSLTHIKYFNYLNEGNSKY